MPNGAKRENVRATTVNSSTLPSHASAPNAGAPGDEEEQEERRAEREQDRSEPQPSQPGIEVARMPWRAVSQRERGGRCREQYCRAAGGEVQPDRQRETVRDRDRVREERQS